MGGKGLKRRHFQEGNPRTFLSEMGEALTEKAGRHLFPSVYGLNI